MKVRKGEKKTNEGIIQGRKQGRDSGRNKGTARNGMKEKRNASTRNKDKE